jgi:hypothetical protein
MMTRSVTPFIVFLLCSPIAFVASFVAIPALVGCRSAHQACSSSSTALRKTKRIIVRTNDGTVFSQNVTNTKSLKRFFEQYNVLFLIDEESRKLIDDFAALKDGAVCTMVTDPKRQSAISPQMTDDFRTKIEATEDEGKPGRTDAESRKSNDNQTRANSSILARGL